MPVTPQTCYGGVRVLDYPCLPNAQRLDQGTFRMLTRFHQHGALLDVSYFQALSAEFQQRLQSIRDEIHSIVGREINPISGDQVGPLLFDELRLTPPTGRKRTATGRDVTDADILSSLKNAHPVVGLILEYRALDKLDGTYARKLPRMIHPHTGRLHTTFRHTSTDTGRLSSENPNLQNIPARTQDGMRIRQGFIPGKDQCGRQCVLASADLSQIEMVLAGDLSQDRNMISAFLLGADIHTQTAVNVFRLDRAKYERLALMAKQEEAGETVLWTDQERSEWKHFKQNYRLPAKTAGFAILYGQSGLGLQGNILSNGGPLWTVEECEKLIEEWFRYYRGIRAWLDLQHSRARRYGMVWDWFGRVRLVPEALSTIPRIRRAAFRQAGNMPIQATAQGILKLATAEIMDLVEQWEEAYPDCRIWPLLQIHDELVFELSPHIAGEFLADVKRIMMEAVELSIPVGASASTGPTWADLK
jgi:DNA polymerase-1